MTVKDVTGLQSYVETNAMEMMLIRASDLKVRIQNPIRDFATDRPIARGIGLIDEPSCKPSRMQEELCP